MATRDPHSHTDTAQGEITDANLRLNVDFEQRLLEGDVTLTLANAKAGPFDLDTRGLEISRVADAEGNDLDWQLGEHAEIFGSRLRIALPGALTSLTIAYSTSTEASALQWLEPSNTAGKVHPYLFSQCQPHHARSIVPIQDSARVRFRYRATITVPDPLVAVMSAAPGNREVLGNGRNRFAFEMPQPIPAYLIALAVGNIEGRDVGPRSRVYCEPEMLEASAWEFAEVDGMLKKAEALFGEYRWQRYDFLVMPPAFPYGGMENPRLTFLTPSLIAGDRSLVDVLAHELAHSWTGNLVTNATMNDFWLNEGFTVWAERRILEALHGEEAVALSAAIGRDDLTRELNRFGMASPLTRLKNDLSNIDPDEVYSCVPYEKGFLLVALLEQLVGRPQFDEFVRSYMNAFQFKSIDTEEFLEFLDCELPEAREKIDLQAWIYEAGLPSDAPAFESRRLKELNRLASGWTEGLRPNVAEAKAWSVSEWLVYLGGLPTEMNHDDCKWLAENFSFNESHNSEILCKWLVIAIRSGYEPAITKASDFLANIGRMKFLKPLYKELHEGEKTRELALTIYERNRESYHPIARSGLELILK
jgi:leukotriene-A4 hydrolase